MALNFYELATSRPVDRSTSAASVVRKWVALYEQDENVVASVLLALVAPIVWDSLPRTSFKLDPKGGGVWFCDVTYSLSASTQTDSPAASVGPTDSTNLGPEYSFDITAQTTHVTQSLSTRHRCSPTDLLQKGKNLVVDAASAFRVTPDGYTPLAGDVGKTLFVTHGPAGWSNGWYTITAVSGGKWTLDASPAAPGLTGGVWGFQNSPTAVGTAPNYQQAVGVTRDAVEGCDVYAPKFEFSVAVQMFPLRLPYLRTLRGVCAKTNNAAWRGFAAGEVLYLGATGQCAPGDVWKVAHKFAVGENLVAIPLALDASGNPKIIVPAKGAWEYLWTAYDPAVDTNLVVQRPEYGYVEKVLRETDFALLGLGS